MIRADWGDVTLAEYDALSIIRRPSAEELLDAYWADLAERDVFNEDALPNALSDEGRAWLAGLHQTYLTTQDEHDLIRMARDFVRSLGTMLTANVARAARS